MKAVVIDKFGGPEELNMRDLPDVTAGAGDLLIRVEYAGVNPVDYKIRQGHLSSALPHDFPLIPGWDAAGVVEGVGSGVSQFSVGDRVFVYARKPVVKMGTYAELLTVPASTVAKIPPKLPFAAAATVPLVALTAWQALFDFAGLRANETILVHAGSGGVGGWAVQFAREAGAKVYSTAGSANQGYLKELGAHVPIDYTKEKVGDRLLAEEMNGVDVVLDCVGGDTLNSSYALLRRGGRLVSIVDTPSISKAAERNLKSAWVFVAPNGEQLARISAGLEDGRYRTLPYEEMPVSRAADAHRKSESRHVRGKLALKVRGGF